MLGLLTSPAVPVFRFELTDIDDTKAEKNFPERNRIYG